MNNTRFKIHPILPLPLYVTRFEGDFNPYLEILNQYGYRDDSNFAHEAAQNYGHKSDNTYILHDPKLVGLASWIMAHFQNYAENILNYDMGQLGFSQSWITAKKSGQRHTMHHHSNSIISGVFYFENNQNIEPISFRREESYFYQPHYHFFHKNESHSPFSSGTSSYTPAPLELVIFPSWTKHEVKENQSQIVRKSLAINTFVNKGILGDRESLTELDFSKLYTPPKLR